MGDQGHVHISSQGVDEMITPFPIGVSVPTDHDNRHMGIGNPYGGGNGKGSAVKAIEKVASQVVGEFGRLSYPGHQDNFIWLQAHINQCLL